MSGIETEREISPEQKLGIESGAITTTKSTGVQLDENQNDKTTTKTTIPDVVRQFLSEIGRKGGSVSSDKKVEAARANGAKGGRPRKIEVCAA